MVHCWPRPPFFCWHTRACLPESLPKPTPNETPKNAQHTTTTIKKTKGYTGFTVGLVNTHYVYLPIPVIIQAPRKVNPKGRRWNRLKTAINMPDLF